MLVIPLFISHHGCPHQCLFCNQEKIAGANTAAGERSDQIRSTLDEWLPRRGSGEEVQVAFFGGSFTCLPRLEQERLLTRVRPYLQAGAVQSVRLSTRPDCIDAERCRFLLDHGVRTVELGVQSLSDTVLRRSRRGHDSAQSRRSIILLREHGFTVGVQLMAGLPGETTVSFLRGIDEVIRLAPDFVRLYPCLVISGSDLAALFAEGTYKPLTLLQTIGLLTTAFARLRDADIRVIRMGLQPTAELENGLIAGPYHPALGELVLSRWWLRQLRRRLAALQAEEKLTVTISPRDRSALVGMRKHNMKRIAALGYTNRLVICTDDTQSRGTIHYAVS